MQYTLDIYERNPENIMRRLAENCRARRLDKGMSRRTLSSKCGVPAPTIERFERTGHISLESFCRIATEFGYYDELISVLSRTKYSSGDELEMINRNRNRIKGR